VPPAAGRTLKEHADRVVGMLKCDPIYRDYVGVLLNNELWRETLAACLRRRLLLCRNACGGEQMSRPIR